MSDKQFKVGQWWRTSGGYKVFIDTILHDQIISGCGRTYELDGRYASRSAWDLVTLIEDVGGAPPAKCEQKGLPYDGNPEGYCEGGYINGFVDGPDPSEKCKTEWKKCPQCNSDLKLETKPLFTVGMEDVTTRDGRKVRILCVDAPGDYPIVGLVNNLGAIQFMAGGRFCNSATTSPNDLIPPPPPKQYAWLNVYRNADGSLREGSCWPSRDKANRNTGPDRAGCIKIELAERWDE